jgi:D-3-phosphoglycerate dehydrogenase
VRLENKTLVLDLLEWVDGAPRTYDEVMDAWRTSCPRLPIWEDTVEHKFVVCEWRDGSGTVVSLTPRGRDFLASERPSVALAAAPSPSAHRA